MASVETTPLLEGNVEATAASPEEGKSKGWKPSAIASDIATLGTGTLLAGLFNVALVFVVPKLLSLEDYGYWRLFGLYAGYAGFVHFGFADGALLRWAGRPFTEVHNELLPSLKFVFWEHTALLVPLGLVLSLVLPPQLRFVGLATIVYAPICNLTAVLHFGLQGARIFRLVAMSTVAAPALFFGSVLLWASERPLSYQDAIGLFLVSSCAPLAFLIGWTKPWSGVRRKQGVKWLAKDCLLSGWPVMIANTGVNLISYADRLAVSWAATIQDFAQYSLAASAVAVPIMAIQAGSKVFFSHLAGVAAEDRKWIYGISSRLLLLAWAILLPYYFALDAFVRRFLARYVPGLEIGRVLLLGIPFLAGIQILHMSFAYLSGRQRDFLWRTVSVLALSLGLTSLVAFGSGSLRTVASVQVLLLGCWWLLNEWMLRDLTGEGFADWVKFLGVYGIACLSYWMTSRPGQNVPGSVALYYGIVVALIGIVCREEFKFFLTHLTGSHGPVIEG